MNFEDFTIKGRQALQTAVERATASGAQAITPLHLLAGVLDEGENVTRFLFGKLGVNEQGLRAAVSQEISRQPKVSGGEPYLDGDAHKVL